jgi:hypothetical protein
MNSNLGSEVPLKAKTLSEANFATKDSLRASAYAWFTKRYRPVALRRIQTWRITKDGQGCHHLPSIPQPWDTRQTRVTCSLDTTSTLTATTLALARNFRLYQESFTRAPVMRTDNKPASK